jgi:hypothetical protein
VEGLAQCPRGFDIHAGRRDVSGGLQITIRLEAQRFWIPDDEGRRHVEHHQYGDAEQQVRLAPAEAVDEHLTQWRPGMMQAILLRDAERATVPTNYGAVGTECWEASAERCTAELICMKFFHDCRQNNSLYFFHPQGHYAFPNA